MAKLKLQEVAAIGFVSMLVVLAVQPAFAVQTRTRSDEIMRRLFSTGKAMLVYVEANEGYYPLQAMYSRKSNRWETTKEVAVPANWRKSATRQEVAAYASVWANSIGLKESDSMLSNAEDVKIKGWEADYRESGDVKPQRVGLNYNGLLHSYPSSGIAWERLPILWTGTGNANLLGAAQSNPVLDCKHRGERCVFAQGEQISRQFAPERPVFVEDGKAFFLYANYSVGWVKLNTGRYKFPNRGACVDPWAAYYPDGKARFVMTTLTHGDPPALAPMSHPTMFRPKEGNWLPIDNLCPLDMTVEQGLYRG